MNQNSVSSQSNNNPYPKNFVPHVHPQKMYQPFVPSTIPVAVPPNINGYGENRNQQGKLNKLSNYQNNYNQAGLNNNINFKQFAPVQKYIPSYIDRDRMKGSMMPAEQESKGKLFKAEGQANNQQLYSQNNYQNPKKFRVGQNQDMKLSNMQLGNEGSKIPSFLQEKAKEKRQQRPESYQDTINSKGSSQKSTLKTSYGQAKKTKSFKQQQQIKKLDPTTQWLKASMDKKKEKQITINDFQLIRQLGAGKYGKVFLVAEKKTGFICALKILEKQLIKQELITEQIIRELKIQMFLNHAHLIKMFSFFDDETNIYLIMQAATGGQLYKQLKKHQQMQETKVANIMRQVCNAVGQLHSHRIIHRDIKPQNIVIHDNVIKLCDFGWSVVLDSNLRTTFCGTPIYVGPQILKGKQYDQKVDIWSLGVMMYEMLIGENPFKITKQQDLIKIIKDQIKIPNYVQLSNEAKDFLMACLQKNPDDRLTIRQLLNHDFFKKNPQKEKKF